jgi:hypothetical protein
MHGVRGICEENALDRSDFIQFLFSEYLTETALLTVTTQSREERQIFPPERPRSLRGALK